MAFILGMRVAVADHQEKRLAGCLPLEKRTRFGGNDLGQIAFLAHSLAIPAHARVLITGSIGGLRRIPKAKAMLRMLIVAHVPLAYVSAFIAAAVQHIREQDLVLE